MKILTICTAFPRHRNDVITPWLVKLLKELENRGHDIYIYTSSYKGIKQKKFNNFKIIRFRYFISNLETLTHDVAVPEKLKQNPLYYIMVPFYIAGGLLGILFYKNYFKREGIDLIHVHWPIPHIIFGYVLKFFLKKPLVCTFHSAELILFKKFLRIPFLGKVFIYFWKKIFKKADYVTVNSNYTKSLLNILDIPDNKIKVIPFGSSLEILEKQGDKTEHKREKKILFVGRLVERKGVEYLIKAFYEIEKDFPEYKLHIVGDGPLKSSLISMVHRLGIQDKVEFLGFVSNEKLIEEYLTSTLFVLPAIIDSRGDTEGLGVVLVEAMYFGLPIVASSVGGIKDIVKNGYNGLLVKEKSIEELVVAMKKLLENEGLRNRISRNAENFIKRRFSWGKIISDFEELYKFLFK